jgi:NADH-quinone oxidoreductase subunit J
MDFAVFWIAAGVAGAAAINLIFQSKPINSVLSLVVVLFALAVLYLQLSAEFIAALQIIIYAGAIMVLFLFVVMLLNLNQDQFGSNRKPGLRSFGVLIGGTLIIEISLIARAFVSSSPTDGQVVAAEFGSVAQVGRLLFGEYLLPFELTSILLLIAVAGALVLAGKREEAQPPEERS